MSQLESSMLSSVGWRYLDICELVRLCRIDSTFANLCQQPTTWQYLLSRDFDVKTEKQTAQYIYFKYVLKAIAKLAQRAAYSVSQDNWIQGNIYYVANLRAEALSALGIDEFITKSIFGNKIGKNLSWKLADILRSLKNEDPEATIIDALFYYAKTLSVIEQTRNIFETPDSDTKCSDLFRSLLNPSTIWREN